MVSVLATAHMHPASTAQTTKCGAWRTSSRTCDVPRMKAGTPQRARKTPNTRMSETVRGEMSGFTSLMGASAPPSQAPAAKPQKMPSACRERRRVPCMGLGTMDATVCTLAGDDFNGACPGARDRQRGRSAESRNGRRWRWRETDSVERSVRLGVTSPPQTDLLDDRWNCGVILGIMRVGSQCPEVIAQTGLSNVQPQKPALRGLRASRYRVLSAASEEMRKRKRPGF